MVQTTARCRFLDSILLQFLAIKKQCHDAATKSNPNMADDPQYAPTGKWEEGGPDVNPASDRSAPSDRELLFGRLAVLNGFVDEETLKAAKQQTDPSKPLDEILVQNGAMTEESRRAIEILVEQHIAQHDDDPQESLSAFAQTICYVEAPETNAVIPTRNQQDGKMSLPSTTAMIS